MELIARGKVDYQVTEHWLGDVVNYNEVALLDLMRDAYAKDASLCRCTTCVEDVYALTLNKAPPRYIQASSIRMANAVHAQDWHKELSTAFVAALERVKSAPNH